MRRLRRPQVALIALVAALAIGYTVNAIRNSDSGTTAKPPHHIASAALSSLPPEVRQTVELIRQGGPFPYEQDGAIFHNAERRLPEEPDGFYREYTVPTPGSEDRGARRIITGKNGEFYYTPDHYDTFVLVDVSR